MILEYYVKSITFFLGFVDKKPKRRKIEFCMVQYGKIPGHLVKLV